MGLKHCFIEKPVTLPSPQAHSHAFYQLRWPSKYSAHVKIHVNQRANHKSLMLNYKMTGHICSIRGLHLFLVLTPLIISARSQWLGRSSPPALSYVLYRPHICPFTFQGNNWPSQCLFMRPNPNPNSVYIRAFNPNPNPNPKLLVWCCSGWSDPNRNPNGLPTPPSQCAYMNLPRYHMRVMCVANTALFTNQGQCAKSLWMGVFIFNNRSIHKLKI